MTALVKRVLDKVSRLPGTRINTIPLWSIGAIILALAIAEILIFRISKSRDVHLVESLPWPTKSVNPDARRIVALRDISGRLLWGLATVLQVVVFVAAAGYFVHVLKARESRRALMGIGVCDLGLALAIFLVSQTSSSRDPVGIDFPGALLSKGLMEVNNSDYIVAVNLQNAMTAAMMLLGILAIGSALGRPAKKPLTQKGLNERIEQLRDLLTVATGALAVGVIQMHFEYRWVSGLLVNQNPKEGLDKPWEPAMTATAAITLAAGGLFSLLLIAAFFPAVLVLQNRVDIHNKTARGGARIALSWRQFYLDALKIIGPVLTAGPLAALVKS
jgi:hypothetical protein